MPSKQSSLVAFLSCILSFWLCFLHTTFRHLPANEKAASVLKPLLNAQTWLSFLSFFPFLSFFFLFFLLCVYFVSLLCFFFFFETGLISTGCPGTHYVAGAVLKRREIPLCLLVLGLKACTTRPGPGFVSDHPPEGAHLGLVIHLQALPPTYLPLPFSSTCCHCETLCS